MTLTQLLLLAAVGLLSLAIASFLRLSKEIQPLLAKYRDLTDGLALSLMRLSIRVEAAENLASSLQAQNTDLLASVMRLRHENQEITFLRSQINTAHDRVLALLSRPALAQVHHFNPRPGDLDERPPDGFSLYPTSDSPVDAIHTPDVRPPVGRETVVVPRPRADSPDGYGEGGGVVLDAKAEQLIFGR